MNFADVVREIEHLHLKGLFHKSLEIINKLQVQDTEIQLLKCESLIGLKKYQKMLETIQHVKKSNNYDIRILQFLIIGNIETVNPNEAKLLIDEYKSISELSLEDEIKLYELQGDYEFLICNFHKSREFYEKALLKIDGNKTKLNVKARLFNKIGLVYDDEGSREKALDIYIESDQIYDSLGLDIWTSNNKLDIATVYRNQGKWDRAIEIIENVTLVFEKYNYEYGFYRSKRLLGLIYFDKGKFDEVLLLTKEVLKYLLTIDVPLVYAKTISLIGSTYKQQGNLNKALRYGLYTIKLSKAFPNKELQAGVISTVGIVYQRLGVLRKSEEYYLQCLEMWNEIGMKTRITDTLYNLGSLYISMGDYEKALDYHTQVLAREIGDPNILHQAGTLNSLGVISFELGDINEALSYTLDSYEKYKIIGNNSYTSQCLTLLIRINLILENHEDIQIYFDELEKMSKQDKTTRVQSQYHFSKGLILMNSKRSIDKFKGLEIFQGLVNEDVDDKELQIRIVRYYCKLLILELKITGDPLIVDKIKIQAEKLKKYAEAEGTIYLKAETLFLEAKLDYLELDLESFEIKLNEALEICEELGLSNLKHEITLTRIEMRETLDDWIRIAKAVSAIEMKWKEKKIEELISRLFGESSYY
ncbi:MAG: tetratricopeptide repeat protein [Candidatus Kariarchaeaceae archaeon]